MPALGTHYLFAKDVISDSKLNFKLYPRLAYIGAQGPDVLFYLGPANDNFGSKLHKRAPVSDFNNLLDYAKKQKSPIRDQLFSYLFGAMLHYLLDQVFHPFVHYRSGFKVGDDPYNYNNDHFKYEAILDYEFLLNHNTNARKEKVFKSLKSKKKNVRNVSSMFGQVFDELNVSSFYKAWKNMLTVQTILYDRFGWKRGFLRVAGLTNNQIFGLIIPTRKTKMDQLDFMNQQKKEWKNPSSLVVYNDDATELFAKAIKKSQMVINIINDAYENKNVITQLKQLCDNKNYNGIDENTSLSAFNSIFK
jgi:hypothetical protein